MFSPKKSPEKRIQQRIKQTIQRSRFHIRFKIRLDFEGGTHRPKYVDLKDPLYAIQDAEASRQAPNLSAVIIDHKYFSRVNDSFKRLNVHSVREAILIRNQRQTKKSDDPSYV